jgi:hypothetical protein
MSDDKVGDHVLVKLSGGRIVEATVKALIETTEGLRIQVSFGSETALTTRGRSSKKRDGRGECVTCRRMSLRPVFLHPIV